MGRIASTGTDYTTHTSSDEFRREIMALLKYTPTRNLLSMGYEVKQNRTEQNRTKKKTTNKPK